MLWQYWLLIPGSYLAGSIPFGYLLGRLKGVDLSQSGSGNIGATNAFRVLGRQLGFVVFFCDLAKGFVPALLGHSFGPVWGVAAGLAAVIGHNWSIFLAFRGGRGAATGMGVALALIPNVMVVSFIIWLLIVFLTGYVSLASIAACVAVTLFSLIFRVPWIYFVFAVPVPVMVVIRHLPNIRRLRNGTESRMSFW